MVIRASIDVGALAALALDFTYHKSLPDSWQTARDASDGRRNY